MTVVIRLFLPEKVYVKLVEEAEQLGIPSYKHIINILTEHAGVPPSENPKKQSGTSLTPGVEGNKVNWGDCKYHARIETGEPYCYNKRKNLSYLLSECQECPNFEKGE